MSGSTRPEVLIVGAGIVGAACAYYLAREGLRVLVLESDFAGGAATGAGMGHVVVMDDSAAQLQLTRYSQRLWNELAPELSADCEVDRCGTLWIAADDEEMQAVRAKQQAYGSVGIATELLDARSLADAEPSLRTGLAGALRVPGDSVLYPPAAACWLLERAREHGATLLEHCRVDSVSADGVVADGRRIVADRVINAAGAQAARLTPGLPIEPRKGHLVITDRYPGFVRHQLVELGYLKSAHAMTPESVAFNLQPRATGQLLIGSSRELVGWDRAVNPRIVRQMLRRAAEFVPRISELVAIRTWTGFRPATPDHLPLIGPWEGGDGLWIAAGHEGLGITTALGTGRLIADRMAGRVPEIAAEPFDPARVRAALERTDA